MRRLQVSTWLVPLTSLALVLSACTSGPSTPSATTAPASTTAPSAPPTTAPATSASPAVAASPAAAGSPAVPGSPVPAVGASPIAAVASPSAVSAAIVPTSPTQTPSGPQQITINALQGEPDTIDPSKSSFNTEAAVIRQVFEPLLRLGPDLKPIPAAATSYDVSADGKTYTFHLDPNGKWSDGKPVTAQDFVYSFQRILDPKTGADYASFFVDAGITGAKDFNGGQNTDPNSLGIKAVDNNTLQIQLDAPIGFLPDLVTLWVVPPLRQDIITAHPNDWTQDPSTYIGNGPFKLSEWVHQDHITLVPNSNYAGTKPILQKVTYLMVTNNEADYAGYQNNERDWTLVPDADVQSVLNDQSLKSQTRQYTELTTFWLIMNNANAPLNDVRVRKALSMGIDRNALIRDISQGIGKPATSMIPPGMPGYQADLGKDIDFNPTQAKQLLSQAGFTDLSKFPQLTFKYANTSANEARAEFIQAQLKQNLGININLQSMESKAYQADYKAKQYDLAFGGWGADYPDPQDWFTGLFGCNASNNKYNYCNEQFDKLAAQGDSATNQDQRLQYYAQAQQILVNDMPVAPLFYRGRLVLVKPYVQGMIITPQDDYPGDFFLNLVSLTAH